MFRVVPDRRQRYVPAGCETLCEALNVEGLLVYVAINRLHICLINCESDDSERIFKSALWPLMIGK